MKLKSKELEAKLKERNDLIDAMTNFVQQVKRMVDSGIVQQDNDPYEPHTKTWISVRGSPIVQQDNDPYEPHCVLNDIDEYMTENWPDMGIKLYVVKRADDVAFDENVSHVIAARDSHEAQRIAVDSEPQGTWIAAQQIGKADPSISIGIIHSEVIGA